MGFSGQILPSPQTEQNTLPDARSLGTMESNGDKLMADRMKKRGMSWTILGANPTRRAKTGQLSRNGELARSCHRRSVHEQNSGQRLGRGISTCIERTAQLPTAGD